MSHDTALASPDRSTAAGVPPVVVETFDGWAPDLTAPVLASVCMRTEAAPR
ncbi:hypothetical protein [Actinomycetospora aeridis]|uniref:Uncharacterized protein n=1 Tax=Actinomycetospora aeridis TaxID=3129231 RepID=A0ABU8N085_9PSEU